MKKVLLFVLVGLILFQLVGCETVKHYPLTEESFADMTDEQLVEAVVAHPKLDDVSLLSSNVSNWFAEECGAYKELRTRENGLDLLYAEIEELKDVGTMQAEMSIAAIEMLIWYESLSLQEK